jgi:hypothetical protein
LSNNRKYHSVATVWHIPVIRKRNRDNAVRIQREVGAIIMCADVVSDIDRIKGINQLKRLGQQHDLSYYARISGITHRSTVAAESMDI